MTRVADDKTGERDESGMRSQVGIGRQLPEVAAVDDAVLHQAILDCCFPKLSGRHYQERARDRRQQDQARLTRPTKIDRLLRCCAGAGYSVVNNDPV